MKDRLKAIWEKIKNFWLKFNKKQRILFVTIFVVIIVVIIVLSKVIGKKDMVKLRACSNETEVVEIRNLLNDNNISATVDEYNNIFVDDSDYVEAKLVLGSNNISSAGYTLDDAVSSSLSTTETVMKEKYTAYLESKFKQDLESMDAIKSARVNISYPETDNSIFSETQDAKITAVLDLKKELSDEQAEAIGLLLATNVGNDNTNSVIIVDSQSNVLYSGNKANSSFTSNSTQKVKAMLENAIIKGAEDLIYSTRLYNDVQIMINLDVNFDNVEVVDHKYTAPDGTDNGLPTHSYVINSEGQLATAGGNPGTESNDSDTDYDIINSDGKSSKYTLSKYDWVQNEVITTTSKTPGEVNLKNSSMAIVCIKNTILTEEEAEEQGLLDDMTWEEYKQANSEPVETTVQDNILNAVATGSGIAAGNVSIIAYNTMTFFDKEVTSSSNPWFVIQIILAVLIAGVLIFIIIRSTRPVAVEETEPELSVEDMLATTKQQQPPVEEIDLQDKSETRKAIEKFVDENPEAVALLLRNWLNEGWN